MLTARGPIWCVLLVVLLAALRGASAAGAQTAPSDEDFSHLMQRLHQTLDSISKDLSELTIVGEVLSELRANIRIVEEAAQQAREEAAAQAAEQQALLDALGPAPAEGEPPEDAATATERSVIGDQLARSLGRVKRANVVLARTQDLLDRAVQEETAALLDAVQQRTVSPLSPAVVVTALSQLDSRFGELGNTISGAWRSSGLPDLWSEAAGTLALIGALTVLIALPLRYWLLLRFGPQAALQQPTATRRFEAAMVVALANAALPALVILALWRVLSASPVVSGDLRTAITVLLRIALEVVPLLGLAYAVLAPWRPQWRLSSLTDRAAARLFPAMAAFAAVLLVIAPALVAISPMYNQGRFFQLAGLRDELGALGGLVGVIVFGLAMLNLVRQRNWRYRAEGSTGEAGEDRGEEVGGGLARTATVLVSCGVVASIVVCGLGYVNLGIFIVSSMTRTMILLGYAFGLRLVLYRGLQVATSAENALGRWLRHRLILDDAGAGHLVFWVMLLVDMLGTAVLAGIVLVLWGLPGALLDQARDLAVNGVDLHGFNLSLLNIGLAIGVFVVLLTGVRVFQRFLSDRVLVQTRLELGVRDALATGVSYVGYVLAALITFAVLGLDVSNIALIFGALSVGIGFGLQHVVSNFVSGLILLVQRPIKTGDWIVVGDQQGYVRRISVISTEIQTFDAAAVIVPNSTMLSNQVINWHLHNKLGRVIIRVGVSYDADPEQVREVLLACAEQNADLLKRPAPQVIFYDFGESSLQFELRFFLREIDNLLRVSSDMRFAIKKAFDDAAIRIPYPQRDLHIRSGGAEIQLVPDEEAPIAASSIRPAR